MANDECPVEVQNFATMLLHIHNFFSTEGIPLHAVYPAWPSGEQGGSQWGEETQGVPGAEAVALGRCGS